MCNLWALELVFLTYIQIHTIYIYTPISHMNMILHPLCNRLYFIWIPDYSTSIILFQRLLQFLTNCNVPCINAPESHLRSKETHTPINILCDHPFYTSLGLQLCKRYICWPWLRANESPPASITAGPISPAGMLWAYKLLPSTASND